jgi:hypothetical protein
VVKRLPWLPETNNMTQTSIVASWLLETNNMAQTSIVASVSGASFVGETKQTSEVWTSLLHHHNNRR